MSSSPDRLKKSPDRLKNPSIRYRVIRFLIPVFLFLTSCASRPGEIKAEGADLNGYTRPGQPVELGPYCYLPGSKGDELMVQAPSGIDVSFNQVQPDFWEKLSGEQCVDTRLNIIPAADLGEGRYIVRLVPQNGRLSGQGIEVTVINDATPPKVDYSQEGLRIAVSASDNLSPFTVELSDIDDGGELKQDSNGNQQQSFKLDPRLKPGDNAFTLRAVDRAGNASQEQNLNIPYQVEAGLTVNFARQGNNLYVYGNLPETVDINGLAIGGNQAVFRPILSPKVILGLAGNFSCDIGSGEAYSFDYIATCGLPDSRGQVVITIRLTDKWGNQYQEEYKVPRNIVEYQNIFDVAGVLSLRGAGILISLTGALALSTKVINEYNRRKNIDYFRRYVRGEDEELKGVFTKSSDQEEEKRRKKIRKRIKKGFNQERTAYWRDFYKLRIALKEFNILEIINLWNKILKTRQVKEEEGEFDMLFSLFEQEIESIVEKIKREISLVSFLELNLDTQINVVRFLLETAEADENKLRQLLKDLRLTDEHINYIFSSKKFVKF